MSELDPTIRVLRDAVAASPGNLSLRRHLAELLAKVGRHDEATEHLREVLKLAPDDVSLKLELAKSYLAASRDSHALVVLESLLSRGDAPAEARFLLARAEECQGRLEQAAHHYREAIEQDPALADEEFGKRLGVTPSDEEPEGVRVKANDGEETGTPEFDIERPQIDFSHVGGMADIKREIDMKVIQPLLRPDLFKAYGKKAGGGILVYGPPGCGKTHLARATAGQVKAGFFAIGIHDVLDMWFGNSEQKMHALFQQAREHSPFVLFFDEVDALAGNRSDLRNNSTMRTVVNQFLAELDGAQGSNDGVLVLAATNAPWHLDPAFRRPGRFDRVLFVPPPDEKARAEILKVILKDKPTDAIDHDKIAKVTKEFSGADLKGLIDVAIEEKLREAMKSGRPEPLTTKDLLAAAKLVKPTTKEWFATARNYVLYSNEGGRYDDVKRYMNL